MLTILHAYSRTNSGDGLLVDLTLQLAKEAFGDVPVRLVASNAATFDSATQYPRGDNTRARAFNGLADNFRIAVSRPLPHEIFADAHLYLAVGGGYLRGSRPGEMLKTSLVHLPQLLASSHSPAPAVYLPQSIGPFPPGATKIVRSNLANVDNVYARDDRTYELLRGYAPVKRLPDLAALEIGSAGMQLKIAAPNSPIVIVARSVPRSKQYLARLMALRNALPNALWALQSESLGNNDRVFYRSLGIEAAGPLKEVLERHPGSPVISVRLHGALQAILAGSPAIHISYERKGFGAYQDLGLQEWVCSVGSFDPERVKAMAIGLLHDPSVYMAALSSAVGNLRVARQELLSDLRRHSAQFRR